MIENKEKEWEPHNWNAHYHQLAMSLLTQLAIVGLLGLCSRTWEHWLDCYAIALRLATLTLTGIVASDLELWDLHEFEQGESQHRSGVRIAEQVLVEMILEVAGAVPVIVEYDRRERERRYMRLRSEA